MTKKIAILGYSLLMMLLLFACQPAGPQIVVSHADVYNEIKLPEKTYDNLELPVKSRFSGVAIKWISKTPTIISDTGVIYKTKEEQAATITLEVTINDVTLPFNYYITIGRIVTDIELSEYFNEISLSDTASGDLILPTTISLPGATLTWTSSDASVMTETGKVMQQKQAVDIIMTATIRLGTDYAVKDYLVVVEALTEGPLVLGFMKSITEFEKETYGKSGLPSKGTFDVLIVPIELKDEKFPQDYKENIDTVFNGSETETGWESVASYYQKSSYGNLNLNFDIADKYTTKNNSSTYEARNDEGDQVIIKEALQSIDPFIDFSKYDYNKDNHIDSIIFIYSVAPNHNKDPWWAWVYAAKFGDAKTLRALDGKNFEYYMWASYYFMDEEIYDNSHVTYNAETYIHELGHLMGFPDLYPYEGNNDYGPVGGWDMMDNNAGDHGPANKLLFGWLRPTIIDTKGTIDIKLESYTLDQDGKDSVILIPYQKSNFSDGDAFDEYLLISFYTPGGLYTAHQGLPHSLSQPGIAIYQVDARWHSSPEFFTKNYIQDNEDKDNFFIELLEVDNDNSLPGNSSVKISDLLTRAFVDLSKYTWNQSGRINVRIELLETITSTDYANLRITVA